MAQAADRALVTDAFKPYGSVGPTPGVLLRVGSASFGPDNDVESLTAR
jgi:hypothetical protein